MVHPKGIVKKGTKKPETAEPVEPVEVGAPTVDGHQAEPIANGEPVAAQNHSEPVQASPEGEQPQSEEQKTEEVKEVTEKLDELAVKNE